MSEAVLILPNMRGGCATVGTTVHTLFRVTSRRPRPMAAPADRSSVASARSEAVSDAPHCEDAPKA